MFGQPQFQFGAGNFSQQNLASLMPWGAGSMPQMPQMGGPSSAQMIGMPAQNLAMFGQTAQQPIMPHPIAQSMFPMQGMPQGMPQGLPYGMPGSVGGQQMLPQSAPMTGSNYLAAILQALQARPAQAQVGVPNPAAWSPTQANPGPSVPVQQAPISSLGQLAPPPPPPAPPPNPYAAYMQALQQQMGAFYGGGEAGGNGGGVGADTAAAGAGGMDVGSSHDTGQTETAAGAAGGFGGGGPDMSSEPGAGGLW